MNVLFFTFVFISFPAAHVFCGHIVTNSDSSESGETETTAPPTTTTPIFTTTTTSYDDDWPTSYDVGPGDVLGTLALFILLISIVIGFCCILICWCCRGCCCCSGGCCCKKQTMGHNTVVYATSQGNNVATDDRGFAAIHLQHHHHQPQGVENYGYHQNEYNDQPPPYSSLSLSFNNVATDPTVARPPPYGSLQDHCVLELNKDSCNIHSLA